MSQLDQWMHVQKTLRNPITLKIHFMIFNEKNSWKKYFPRRSFLRFVLFTFLTSYCVCRCIVCGDENHCWKMSSAPIPEGQTPLTWLFLVNLVILDLQHWTSSHLKCEGITEWRVYIYLFLVSGVFNQVCRLRHEAKSFLVRNTSWLFGSVAAWKELCYLLSATQQTDKASD